MPRPTVAQLGEPRQHGGVQALTVGSRWAKRRLVAASEDLEADVPAHAASEVTRIQSALADLLGVHVAVGFEGLATTPDRLGLG